MIDIISSPSLSRISLTVDESLLVYHNGSSHADLHDLRNSYERCVYFDLPISAFGLSPSLVGLLETR